MRPSRVLIVGALVACAAGFGAAPAEASGTDLRARVAKHEAGPWQPGVGINLGPGQAKTIYLKVKSLTGSSEAALLWQQQDMVPYETKTKYFKGDENISAEVNTFTMATPSGYEFTARAGKFKKFRVKVKSLASTTPAPSCVVQGWAPDVSPLDSQTSIDINGGCD